MTTLDVTYAATKALLLGAVADAGDGGRATVVPASPEWTIADVVAHVATIASEMTTGPLVVDFDLMSVWRDDEQRDRLNAWTGTGVELLRSLSFADVVNAWDTACERLVLMLEGTAPFPDGIPPFVGVVLTTDLAVHTADVLGALGRPVSTPGDDVALGAYTFMVGGRIDQLGLPALELRTPEGEAVGRLGQSPDVGATATAPRTDLIRALSGRRSTRQIAAFAWDGDPAPYLEVLPAYGPRVDDLVES